MNFTNPSILIVDDEWLIAFNLQLSLQKLGYKIAGTARTADEALEMAERTNPDLILMDIRIEGELDGIQAAEKSKKNGYSCYIYDCVCRRRNL